MTKDAKESLTALLAVLLIFAVIWLLPVAMQGVEIPKWMQVVGLALQIGIVLVVLIRPKRRNAA